MSYCRFAWDGSDVYVYPSDSGITCCACSLGGFHGTSPEEAIAHLAAHRRAGDFVPPYAIALLWEEIPGAAKPTRPAPPGMTTIDTGGTGMTLGDLLKRVPGAADALVYPSDPLDLNDWCTVHLFLSDKGDRDRDSAVPEILAALTEAERQGESAPNPKKPEVTE